MIDLTEAATFDTPITVPEGTDTHGLAAENVQDIAQRLANRSRYLKARADDAAQRGSPNTFTAHNEFTQSTAFDIDINVSRDVIASRDVNASNNLACGQDIVAGRDTHAFRNAIANSNFVYPTPKPRTSIVSLNTGVVMGVAQVLFRDTFTYGASCTSWISGQLVAWRLLVPTGAVITSLQVIHEQVTTDPNQFNIVKRHGAVYDLFGASTRPMLTPLATAVNGPATVGLWTALVIPTATLTVDNSVNEYWFIWKSTGLHSNDAVSEISVNWNDVGPRND